MFTVINLVERVETMSVIEMESTINADKISLYDLNVQNKWKSSECNSCTGFFSLRE